MKGLKNLELSTNNKCLKDVAIRPMAGSGQRVANLIIDIILIYALQYCVGYSLILGGLLDYVVENAFVINIMVFSFYYVSLEGLFGRTMGKIITGTIVLNDDGSKVALENVIARTACRLIPFEVFSFLGGDGHPMGWHDRFSKTKVVSLRQGKVHVEVSR